MVRPLPCETSEYSIAPNHSNWRQQYGEEPDPAEIYSWSITASTPRSTSEPLPTDLGGFERRLSRIARDVRVQSERLDRTHYTFDVSATPPELEWNLIRPAESPGKRRVLTDHGRSWVHSVLGIDNSEPDSRRPDRFIIDEYKLRLGAVPDAARLEFVRSVAEATPPTAETTVYFGGFSDEYGVAHIRSVTRMHPTVFLDFLAAVVDRRDDVVDLEG